VKFLGTKVPCALILRVRDCIVTISFGVHSVVWLFLTCFVMCGCLDNCVGVFVIRVLVFIVFCIVCTVLLYCIIYLYLFLFVLSVRTTATE
jgi:hypothetical protein